MDIIQVDNLKRRFKQAEAVKGVSFTVHEGEIFGFLGPNGAGKTTTINMLCTLLRPSGGSATVNGFDILRQRSQVRRSIGLVFQETTLDDYLTAEQNLRFHAYAYFIPGAERERRIREMLELVELWERRRDRIRTYSGGMKRRLEIARGLLHHPKVLFLDEPTLGLDPQTRRRIWDHILELRTQKRLTIFLTTHYMDEAEHCDRIAIIDHGVISALDTPGRLKTLVGGDVVTLRAEDNERAAREVHERFNLAAESRDGAVRFQVPQGETFLGEFARNFPMRLLSLSLHRPTLDDVFVHLTGHEIREEAPDFYADMRRWRR